MCETLFLFAELSSWIYRLNTGNLDLFLMYSESILGGFLCLAFRGQTNISLVLPIALI